MNLWTLERHCKTLDGCVMIEAEGKRREPVNNKIRQKAGNNEAKSSKQGLGHAHSHLHLHSHSLK